LVKDPSRSYPLLADPLRTLVSISRDPQFRWELKLLGGRSSTAVNVQREYLQAVRELCDLEHPERAMIVRDWEEALNDLETDFIRCRDRLDWVAKHALISEFQASQNIAEDDPWLRSLDLEYSRLDLQEGLYFGLEQQGAMRLVVPEDQIQRAIHNPPSTTRAYVRGRCVQKFAESVLGAQWDHITLEGSQGPIKISLLDLFAPREILQYARTVDAASSPDDLKQIVELPR
jgi:proteasome accessory factor A